MMHNPREDFFLQASKPHLDGGKMTGDKPTGMYDQVEQVQYLYVRVLKGRDLPAKDDVTGSCDPCVEVRLGNNKGTTRHLEKKSNPKWNQVFGFCRDRIQASVLEVTVKDIDFVNDDFMGWVLFDVNEVPKRIPPDSPLAPEWYQLKDRKGNTVTGELMLAVWWGTKADGVFPEAMLSDVASVGRVNGLVDLRSKVYLSPSLWYLRVNVIEAHHFVVHGDTSNKSSHVLLKATLAQQSLMTIIPTRKSVNPVRNQELMFVVAEPFEEPLVLSVEERSAPYNNKVVGMCTIHLQNVERRLDQKAIPSRWYNLENNVIVNGENEKEVKFTTRLCLRLCLEGGYHVVDESTHYLSDLRPTSEKLWKKSIGFLEVGFLGASGLVPMKMKDGMTRTDAYCVAKYGRKWVRTRTIIDSLAPKWNEQYTWEVFDPCTVITICVFDNCHLQEAGWSKDIRMGKVRIRLSTLETDCIYTHAYPLLVLHPSGVSKMGEIHLAVRFTCSSLLNMMHMYSQPLLPKMHYISPLTDNQLPYFRYWASQIVSMRLCRDDPPLRKEVAEYMLDMETDKWSIRRTKANFVRSLGFLNGPAVALKWFDDIRNWNNPITTILIHIIFVILVLYPVFILPSVFLCLFLLGVWNRRSKPRHPPNVDIRLSQADTNTIHPDEIDEEFDTFPSSAPDDLVRMRYDRLRTIFGRIQTYSGNLAEQVERLQSLLSWRDPRATTLFIVFCLIAAIVLYAKPFYVVVIQIGFTLLNHPRFQHNLPLVPINFFTRLPSKSECML